MPFGQTQHYNKESIQQLVMDAETLVREDHLIQELARKYSFSADKRAAASPNAAKSPVHHSESSIQNALPKIKRVHDWLMHQQPPLGGGANGTNGAADVDHTASTDCEASAENTGMSRTVGIVSRKSIDYVYGFPTESDSSAARDSDTSDIMSDSVATCLQETDHRSSQFFTSTERIDGLQVAGSAELLPAIWDDVGGPAAVGQYGNVGSPNVGPPKVVMRTKRRNSERPWSVSCLSQLRQTETSAQARALELAATNQGLANHSISESALHMWSTTSTVLSPSATVSATTVATTIGGDASTATATATTATSPAAATVNQSQSSMRSVESKNSLKRRKMRARKKLLGRKSESGSNGSDHNGGGGGVQELSRLLTSTLSKSETFAGRTDLVEDLSAALSMLALPRVAAAGEAVGSSGTLLEPPAKEQQQHQPRASSDPESEEEATKHMTKPNFRLGAYTSSYGAGASKLGSLAALANYNSEIEGKWGESRCLDER